MCKSKGDCAYGHSMMSFNDFTLSWQGKSFIADLWKKVFCEDRQVMIPKICLGTSDRKRTVLVTGGSGFLGQHIVKLLQEGTENVKEIRVFDTRPYKNNLEHSQVVPIRSIVGDIRSLSDLREAMNDVDMVIHTAGLVSFGTFPQTALMQEVNVKGTANVIQAAVEQNVSTLVYTSTVDVVIGFEEIFNGDESLPVPSKFLFPGYPTTKYQAEQLVNAANGRILAKGDANRLHTVCLRPNVMYGEGDPYFVINGLRAAKESGGILTSVGDGSAKFQQAYVGNVAWAHLCALHAVMEDPGLGGRNFFVTDDTPLMNSFVFMKPFLRCRGFDLSENAIPYRLVYAVYYCIDWVLWAIRPIIQINLDIALPSIIYVNQTFYFNRRNAEDVLKYKPLYGYQTSLGMSMEFYKKAVL